MIAMRMGAQDRGNFCIAHGAHDCLDMAFAIHVLRIADAEAASGWTRIDDCNFTSSTNQPGLGTCEGIGRWIGCKHAANQRFVLFGFACLDAVGPVAHAAYMVVRTALGNEKGAD